MSIFLNSMYQSAAQQATESKSAAMNAELMANEVKWQVNKLTLINRALFELLHEKFGLTEAELVAKMTEIDIRDSHQDGCFANAGPIACEACGKTYSRHHNHCLYCGHVNATTSPF